MPKVIEIDGIPLPEPKTTEEMKAFNIIVSLTVPFSELDADDKEDWAILDDWGGRCSETAASYPIQAKDADQALDFFHEKYAISNLEHFDISVY